MWFIHLLALILFFPALFITVPLHLILIEIKNVKSTKSNNVKSTKSNMDFTLEDFIKEELEKEKLLDERMKELKSEDVGESNVAIYYDKVYGTTIFLAILIATCWILYQISTL
jgi:hypothetical protein